MTTSTPEQLLEKIKQQFDAAPYPNIPLEVAAKDKHISLYQHNLTTAFYARNHQVVSTQGKLILDVGCGSGYTSLVLAEANPGAKVVGIDLSDTSIDLARKRLQHYGFGDAEFHVLTVEELPKLNMRFDYINCDEVLYLLLDPVLGLKAMREVLAPDGIIRANFHSSLQRKVFLQVQEIAKTLGLMEAESQEQEIHLLRGLMNNLKPHVFAKKYGWSRRYDTDNEAVLANHLLRGDKGWTLPEFFDALEAAELEFINMVDWRTWDLLNLFSDVDELPIEIALALGERAREEQLHMYELLHPDNHRLLDLWCGHPNQSRAYVAVEDWRLETWQAATVHLHPQLLTEQFKQDLVSCVSQFRMLDLTRHLPHSSGKVTIDSMMAACLLPLLEGAQPFELLTRRWQTLRPLNPITLEPTSAEQAYEMVHSLLSKLEELGYVLLEQSSE